jgi:hypothetical protein
MATKSKPHEMLHRLEQPLDEVRAALKGVGKDLRAGGRDLYGDVETLARSTRRDTVKLGTALRSDIGRLAKAPGASTPPPRRRAAGSHRTKKAAA